MIPALVRSGTLAALALHLLSVRPLGAQESGARSDRPEITLSGRVQTQFNTTSVNGEPAAEWRLRRVRLEAKVRVNDRIRGKVQPDFSGSRVRLKDAYLALRLAPGTEALVGQAHRPFSMLTRYSSLRMLPIEKGLDVRGAAGWDELRLVNALAYSNRAVGVQLIGEPDGAPLGLSYVVGVFRGPEADLAPGDRSVQVVARAGIRPAEHLALGGAWSRRRFADQTKTGERSVRAGNAFVLDLAYEPAGAGPLLLGEAVVGDFDPWTRATFAGAHAWLGWRLEGLGPHVSRVEPLLRVSYGSISDPSQGTGGVLVTPGLNLYFGPLSRVMVNLDRWHPADGAGPQRSAKVMFQVAF